MILYQDRFGPEGRRNVRRIPAPAARGLSAAAVKCLSLVMLYLAKIDFQNRNCKVKNIPSSCAKGAANMILSTKGTKGAAKLLLRMLGRDGFLKFRITNSE